MSESPSRSFLKPSKRFHISEPATVQAKHLKLTQQTTKSYASNSADLPTSGKFK